MSEVLGPSNPAQVRSKLRRALSVVWVTLELLAEPGQLLTVALICCALQGISWKTAVFGLLSLVELVAFPTIVSIFPVIKNMRRLKRVRADFPDLRLKQIPLSHYAAYLKTTYPCYESWKESDFLPHSNRFGKGRIFLLVPDDGTALLLPGTFTTYNVMVKAWIVIPAKFDQMTNLQHFILLHELGHAGFRATQWLNGYTEILLNFSLCALFVTFAKMSVTTQIGMTLSMLLIAALVCLFFSAKHWGMRSGENDEISADEFALARCDPAWFSDFDAEALAEALSCQTSEASQTSQNNDLRRRILAYNISQIRSGGELCSQREATAATIYDRLVVPLFLGIY